MRSCWRSIIFSAPMLKVIPTGQKTQTRRIIKPQPPAWVDPKIVNRTQVQHLFQWTQPEQNPPRKLRRWPADGYITSPFSFPVMYLWVRETLRRDAKRVWRYAADDALVTLPKGDARVGAMLSWAHHKEGAVCSPIHMPRWASRHALEVLDVRAERLQDISEEDAIAEGVSPDWSPCDHPRMSCADVGCLGQGYRAGFCDGWSSLHGNDAWKKNPWVWVVEFKYLGAPAAVKAA